MLKKSFFVLGGLMLLAGLVLGRDAVSYVTTSVSQMRQSVKDQMPVAFEFERAKRMLESVDSEIARNHKTVVRQELEIEKLSQAVKASRGELAELKDRILERSEDLKAGTSHYVYANRTFTRDQVARDLKRRLSDFQIRETTLNKREQILAARESALLAAKEKVSAMTAQRSQLEVTLEDLKARQELLEVEQAKSELNLDDSYLARTRDLLDNIEARITVDSRLAEVDSEYEVPFDEDQPLDITEQVTRYFSDQQRAEIEALANAN